MRIDAPDTHAVFLDEPEAWCGLASTRDDASVTCASGEVVDALRSAEDLLLIT